MSVIPQPYDQPVSRYRTLYVEPAFMPAKGIQLPVMLKVSTAYHRGSILGRVAATPGMYGAYSSGTVTGVNIANAGTGYTTAPTLTFSPPVNVTNVQATAIAVIEGGKLVSLRMINPGFGYGSAPTLTIAAPPAGGTQATASVTIANGQITSFTITAAGAGYSATPAVTISDPSAGTTATATATVTSGAITAVAITNAGTNYTSAPTITVSGGGGTGGVLVATLANTAGDGTDTPIAVLQYDVVTDAQGRISFGAQIPQEYGEFFGDTPAWFAGPSKIFRTEDLVGVDANCGSLISGTFSGPGLINLF